jgi:hypothetical protein
MDNSNLLQFRGGVLTTGQGGSVKFLLFLLNGRKELSMSEGKRYSFIERQTIDSSILDANLDSWVTACPVVKIFLQEREFGKPMFWQSFYLALGSKMEKQIVTIQPRNTMARGHGYMFRAEAKFLKKSEVLQLLDPESIGYSILLKQQMLPVQVLREIVTITRPEPPQEVRLARHGAVRHLRLN